LAIVVAGDAVEAITTHARKGDTELIVVDQRHLDTRAARRWQGSIARASVGHGTCSVLVVITH
jgi:nucleotide-binding universal stress UspA family protein